MSTKVSLAHWLATPEKCEHGVVSRQQLPVVDPRVRFLPLVNAVLLPVTYAITYLIARFNGHISGFPYISDTGALAPEACIFGQMHNIVAVLHAFSIYFMYRTVREKNWMERIALLVGLGSALGISIVGNFRQTDIFWMHGTGATIAFGGCTVYMWLRTASVSRMRFLRLMLCVFATLTLPANPLFAIVASLEFRGANPMKWGPDDGGYMWHVLSVACEWLTAGAIDVFFLTTYVEMSLETSI